MIDCAAAARQWACQQHVLRCFHLLDAKRYDELVGLFEPAASWTKPGSSLQGTGEIAASLRQRPVQRVTRHVVTNVLVTADDGTTVHLSCLLTTYAADTEQHEGASSLVDSVAGLFTADVALRVAAPAPRIAQLALAPVWTFARGR